MGRWIRGRWICVWGAPDVSPNRSETLQNKGFRGLWTENRGAPKTQIQRPQIQRLTLGPLKKGDFQKGGFGRCSPVLKFPPKGFSLQCYPGRRNLRFLICLDTQKRKERGHIRQNRPSTKPPFCFLTIALIFHSLVFRLKKTKSNHPKHQGIFTPLDPSRTTRKLREKQVKPLKHQGISLLRKYQGKSKN